MTTVSHHVITCATKDRGSGIAAHELLAFCAVYPDAALGGATGNSPIPMWQYIWEALSPEEQAIITNRKIFFLDEYFGAHPLYYEWARRTLRVGYGGFTSGNVFVPRGTFYDANNCVVNSARLERILSEHTSEWSARTEPGEDGNAPEIRISFQTHHPMLMQISTAMILYDQRIRSEPGRLQILGIGVGGAIQHDPEAGGHIGFVEYGAAARDTNVMLVRLASSTITANKDDFLPDPQTGMPYLEPSWYAITQGIATILSAEQLLLLAWGKGKAAAVSRMFFGTPGPKNPAAWVQEHPNVTVILDKEAWGELSTEQLQDRGWSVDFPDGKF